MAAPLGNQNNVTHGLKMSVGRLPKGCHYIDAACAKMRSALELLAVEVLGKVGPFESLVIQSAVRWEKHAQLCLRWLRLAGEAMTHSERLAYSREICRASTERDRALDRLGLGKPVDPLGWLYAEPAPAPEPPADPPPAVAAAATVEPLGADPGAAPGDPWGEPAALVVPGVSEVP